MSPDGSAGRKRTDRAPAKWETEVGKRLEEQATLLQAMAIVSSSLDLPTVLTRIAEQMCISIDATSAYIARYDQESNTSSTLAEYVGPEACPEERVPDFGRIYEAADSEFLAAIHANQCYTADVDGPYLPEGDRAYMRQYGAKSILYVPLWIREQVVGYVELWESRRRREFSPEEIALCQGIAGSAAIAIENARLYEAVQQELVERKRAEEALAKANDGLEAIVEKRTSELRIAIEELRREIAERKRAEEALQESEAQMRKRLEEQTTLREAMAVISSTLDLPSVLTRIAEQMCISLDATSAYINTFDAETKNTTVLAEYFGPEARPKELVSDLGETYEESDVGFLAAMQVNQHRINHVDDPKLPEGDRAVMLQYGAKSILYIPLWSRDGLVGYAEVWESRGRREFTSQEIALCEGIAQSAAIAIENARLYEETERLAATDALTGLWNRRHIWGRLQTEMARAQRSGHELSVLVMDIEDLKLFNDTYGHAAGDEVICSVAQTILNSCRKVDIVGRYGGDEFAAILTETGPQGAAKIAGRILAALETQPFEAPDGTQVPVSISMGAASYPSDGDEVDGLLSLADAAMYSARVAGGGQFASLRDGPEDFSGASVGSFDVLKGLLITVDSKDHYTFKHSQEVTQRALVLARALGMSEEEMRPLEIAGQLHDVGKIGVRTDILRKPGALTPDEWKMIYQHPRLGHMLLNQVPADENTLQAVLHHHERYDGKGYPDGLKREEIPLLARILAVADAFSAMVTDRPYRKALTLREALDELRRNAGKQLDPTLAEKFIELAEKGEIEERSPSLNFSS